MRKHPKIVHATLAVLAIWLAGFGPGLIVGQPAVTPPAGNVAPAPDAAPAVSIAAPAFPLPRYLTDTPIQTGTARKAEAKRGGLYRLPPGIGNLYDAGQSLPVFTLPAGNGASAAKLVYLRPVHDFYTDTNVVWSGQLRFDGPPGRIPPPDPQAVLHADGTLTGFFRAEEDRQFQHNLNKPIAPNWYFGEAKNLTGPPVRVEIPVQRPLPGPARLVVALNGNGARGCASTLSVKLNDQPLAAAIAWKDNGYRILTVAMDGAILRDGINTVTLLPDPDSVKFLDYVEIQTPISPALREGELTVRTEAAKEGLTLTLPGLRFAADITGFGQESLLPVANETVAGLRGERLYHFCAAPAELSFGPPLSLREPPLTDRNYVAVATADMVDALAPLLRYHAANGLSPIALSLDDIDDVYGCGLFGPAGLVRLVRTHTPEYLLLAGGTNRDYKNYQGKENPNPRGIPAGLIQPEQLTVSDDIYHDGFKVKVGRIIARNRAELDAWVHKCLAFRPGDKVLLWAGDDRKVNFSGSMGAQVGTLPGVFVTSEGRPVEQVKGDIAGAIREGATLVLYEGHAQSWHLDRDLLTGADVERIEPSSWILSTCNCAYYHADYDVFLRTFLVHPTKGAVGAIAASSIGIADTQNELVTKALAKLAAQPDITWGDLFLYLKQNIPLDEKMRAADPETLRMLKGMLSGEEAGTMEAFILVADPAMPVLKPDCRRVRIDAPAPNTVFGRDDTAIPLVATLAGDWTGGIPRVNSLQVQFQQPDGSWADIRSDLSAIPGTVRTDWLWQRLNLTDNKGLRIRIADRSPAGLDTTWAQVVVRLDRTPPERPVLTLRAMPGRGNRQSVYGFMVNGRDDVSGTEFTQFQLEDKADPAETLETAWIAQRRLALQPEQGVNRRIRCRTQDTAGNISDWSDWFDIDGAVSVLPLVPGAQRAGR